MAQSREATGSALNVLYQQLSNLSTENQYVTFQIGSEEYGIGIMLVQEIIRYNAPTRVFNANPVIRGVINFRGKVIPVIDMYRKFNLPEQEPDASTVVIIIESGRKTIGMVVERVSDIISFNSEDIQAVDGDFAEDIKAEHLKGIAKFAERIVLLLDPERVLSLTEQKQVQELQEQLQELQELNASEQR